MGSEFTTLQLASRLKQPLDIPIRHIHPDDRGLIKRLETKYSDLLGFIPITGIIDPTGRNLTLIYPGRGYVHTALRKRDSTWTISRIGVDEWGHGVGRLLMEQLIPPIEAKCLADNPSDGFWPHLGFKLQDRQLTSIGRTLNIWHREDLWSPY